MADKKKTKGKAEAAAAEQQAPAPPPRLRAYYRDTVRPKLAQEFGLDNPQRLPRLEKIVINVGLGEAPKNAKLLDTTVDELAAISGQKPVVTRAKKAISNFALRQGMPVGVRVTLRGARMYEFLDRFISVAVPRIRDFRGFPTNSFDDQGADDLPRDRLRQGREDPRDGHHLRDDGRA